MRISDWSSDVCSSDLSDPVGRMQRGRKFYAFSASTPGNGLPSIHSRKAPPAVETKVKSLPTPAWLSAATVSPPPATEISEPSRVSAAAGLASATVAVSNGGVANAPSRAEERKTELQS